METWHQFKLFDSGTVLYAEVRPSNNILLEYDERNERPVKRGLHQYLIKSEEKYFVPFMLLEELRLGVKEYSGRKIKAELQFCRCELPFERGWIGKTVNETYTRISQHFEDYRRSHTGNAFNVVHYLESRRYIPLNDLRTKIIRAYYPEETKANTLAEAIEFAVMLHKGQTRKTTNIPYVSHLLAVCSLVMENGGTDDEIVAALLHDAAEDNGGQAILDEIASRFSLAIANVVEECTDSLASRKPNWRTRKENFVRELPNASRSARLVIAADKLHNARCILSDLRQSGEEVWKRFSGGKEGVLWYYKSIVEVLLKTGPHRLASELDRVVRRIEKEAGKHTSGFGFTVDNLRVEDNYRQIQSMVGLAEIKAAIQEDIDYVLYQQERRRLGFDTAPAINLHMVFAGNPGTGKTKVARLLGSIYKNLGLLSKGHVIEVDRGSLIGDVIGATERKTLEAIEAAIGGFLFIDDAYALHKHSSRDYGNEVIDVLLKAMSEIKEDFGVIVAGYPDEMESFVASNPGLKSRFGRWLHFPDYTPPELLQILRDKLDSRRMRMTKEALEYVEKQLFEAYRKRDNAFGNARFVKSLLELAMRRMASRLYASNRSQSLENLSLLTKEDFKSVMTERRATEVKAPIDTELLHEARDRLQKLVGIPSVKQEVMEYVKLVHYHRLKGKDPQSLLSSHFVFTGNPGTGKTTVARILADILKALGLLKKGHLVECDRQSLVAGYIGQTALKTEAIIQKSLGGVLFIDEAYALSTQANTSDFGQEAVETLLKRMEDNRGEFVAIVAGYPEEMETFLSSNPGLRSRFDTYIHFDDYDGGEMLSIAKAMIADEGLSLEPEAENHLKVIVEQYVLSRSKYSGNARDVRKLVKKIIRNHHLRIASSTELFVEENLIKLVDLDTIKIEQNPPKRIGFVSQ